MTKIKRIPCSLKEKRYLIKEQYDGDNGEIISYTFSDGASLYLDYNITWTSATSSLYAYLGVQQSDI